MVPEPSALNSPVRKQDLQHLMNQARSRPNLGTPLAHRKISKWGRGAAGFPLVLRMNHILDYYNGT